MRAESSHIVRLSTSDVATADRLNYASSILSSALAPSALSTSGPRCYLALEVAALELPSIAIVAQRGSPQRAIRARPEIRRTSQHCFFLVLVLSGSWQVTRCEADAVRPRRSDLLRSRYPLQHTNLAVRMLHSPLFDRVTTAESGDAPDSRTPHTS